MELPYGTARYDKTNRTVLRCGTIRQNEQNCPTVRHDTTKPRDISTSLNIDFSYVHGIDEQCYSSRNGQVQNIACVVQILTLIVSSHNSISLAVQMAYLLQFGFIVSLRPTALTLTVPPLFICADAIRCIALLPNNMYVCPVFKWACLLSCVGSSLILGSCELLRV